MGGKKPRQSDLRRASSTTYYALFHAMCRNCADAFIGTNGADRSKPAWTQAYRSVQHGYAKGQCDNQSVLKKFPKAVEDFANAFFTAQVKRESADYDPDLRLTRSEVTADIDTAEAAIKGLRILPMKDKRAFAAWVALRRR